MSRALDKDVAALIAASDPTEAFTQISSALVRPSVEGLLEIEILGRSHPVPPGTYFLQDGNALAVPKLALVLAFIAARKHLKEYLERPHGSGAGSCETKATEEKEEEDLQLVSAATAVMLLMDPEHLTAANTRKRALVRLQRGGCGGGSSPQQARFAEGVRAEARLIDSLLTSRLHRHTKSPTLWSHRRWLLQMCVSSGVPAPVDVYGGLVDVVMVAAERHPRNYYAWCHARWLVGMMGKLSPDAAAGGTSPSLSSGEGSSSDDHNFERIFGAVKDWAFRHHTDISGWSFLWYLLATRSFSPAVPSRATANQEELALAVFLETTKLSASLRWTNESVWVFLRTLVASGLVGSAGEETFYSTSQVLKNRLPEDSVDLRTLQKAETWIESNRAAVPTGDVMATSSRPPS